MEKAAFSKDGIFSGPDQLPSGAKLQV